LPTQWSFAEESAKKHDQKVDRKNWRVVISWHLAESKKQAELEAVDGLYKKLQTTILEEAKSDKKADDRFKPVEVVFVIEGDHVKAMPVKIGISDDNFWEITDGLKEGDEIVTGGFKAIGRELDDGKKISKNSGGANADKSKS